MRSVLTMLIWCMMIHVTAAVAPVPATGAGDLPGYSEDTREDGTTRYGVAWPNPRFTINGNGTVTDHLTSLIWLKNANGFGLRTWSQALADCAALASGQQGLTDGSMAGQWRLPSIRELKSLVCLQYTSPALVNTVGSAQWTEGNPFSAVQSNYYWSSTTSASIIGTGNGYSVYFFDGLVGNFGKTNTYNVWPVRGGP